MISSIKKLPIPVTIFYYLFPIPISFKVQCLEVNED